MLLRALQTEDTYTENGMPAHSTSGNPVLDMWFKLGGARGNSDEYILELFQNAFAYDPVMAVRCLFYNRNIRGGQGERHTFRVIYHWLGDFYPDLASYLLPFVPEFGRWDDLLELVGTEAEQSAFGFIAFALTRGDKLCAKWMPRENKSKKALAKKLIAFLGITPKAYRRLLAGNTQVVESMMCSRRWTEIQYKSVPSKAMSQYDDAFGKHDKERFLNYLKTAAVNAAAIFPVDVLKPYLQEKRTSEVRDARIENQWAALPNYLPDGEMILPLCDVSSSMNGQPMQVCIALGLYLAERNKGPFQNAFITFSQSPTLEVLYGESLKARVQQLHDSTWGGNTNLHAAMNLILNQAIKHHIPQSEMPARLLILSDMQFDEACPDADSTALQMISKRFAKAGYDMPQIVFWNLRSANGFPAKENDEGVVLLAGYSPAVISSLFDVKFKEPTEVNPLEVMLNTLTSDPYSKIDF